MEYDIGKSFREIHGTKEAWCAKVEQIIDEALVRIDNESPFRLRFLKRLRDNGDGHSFMLTPLMDVLPGSRYVSVSYCWRQPLPPKESAPCPEYKIWETTNAIARAPRCPSRVLHRAARFAEHKQCDLLWIDQECIDQSDAIDVERHLQIMHRVYKESLCTVAPLATHWPSKEVPVEDLTETLMAGQEPSLNTLRFWWNLTLDEWYRRAWTFQERFCSTELFLLVPMQSRSLEPGPPGFMMKQEDLCLDCRGLESAYKGAFLKQALSKSDIPRKATQEVISATNGSGSKLGILLHWLQNCDCSILADRLSIIANVCDLPWKLLSNRLDRPEVGYKTCVFALLFANRIPLRSDRAVLYANSEALDEWFDDSTMTYLRWGELRSISTAE